jgi:hypothetical protein
LHQQVDIVVLVDGVQMLVKVIIDGLTQTNLVLQVVLFCGVATIIAI